MLVVDVRAFGQEDRDAGGEGRLVVVDLKTAARKYTDIQVEASLRLSVYSYATTLNGLADKAAHHAQAPPPVHPRRPERVL